MTNSNTLILIQCKDTIGLVSAISGILAQHQLNIISMREFVDEPSSSFFARIEFKGTIADMGPLHEALTNALPPEASITINPSNQKKIAILVTKEYHCLGDILMRNFFGTLGAEVLCVIGNYENLRAITERFSLPFHYISHLEKDAMEFEEELLNTLAAYELDYLVLAKFMRVLSSNFIGRYPGQIINIHHSFLPAFVGANPYQKAFNRGVKIIGATAHFATNDLDEGPIIAQQVISVNHNYNASQMRVAGKEIEKAVLNKALSLLIENRVFINGNKTIIFE